MDLHIFDFHLDDVAIPIVELSFHTQVCISFLFFFLLARSQSKELLETLHPSTSGSLYPVA